VSTEDDSENNRLHKVREEGWWRGDDSEEVEDDEDDDEYDDEYDDEDEEDLDQQQDIEEHEYTIPGDATRTLKIRLFWVDDQMGGFEWMNPFVAECTCDGVTVATAVARYIRRERMRSGFWETMEALNEETCDVAYHVFDRYGTVKAKYRDHPVQRGAGVWGNELDHGPLFLMEKIHVTALELRRQGLGQKVVSLLLEKAQQFCRRDKPDGKYVDHVYGSNEAFERAWTLHALVSPGSLTADIESQLEGKSAEERLMIQDRAESGAIDFWRSCGFRRIGASRCFAFSFNLQHQSRALAAASDFDPRRSQAKDLEDEELQDSYYTDPFTEGKDLKMGRLRDTLPLHHAALTLTDQELQAFFITHTDDGIGWDRVTNSDATLLHLTACELKPLSTRWLLENVHHSDSWKTTRDIDGYTPLEALQEKLEKIRTRRDHGLLRILNVSDQFEGHSDTAVSCLSLLLGQDALGPSKDCLRYGCTCGECVNGLLSARMRSSLIFQGMVMYDRMQDEFDDGDFWTIFHDSDLEQLDPNVRNNLRTDKSLREGFVNMFEIAVECLQAKQVPTAGNLEQCCSHRNEWPPHTKNYLRRAGVQMGCRAVLRVMFDNAELNDEKAGNGDCQRILKKEWSDLPTCRNDHEFEFVARACGYEGDDRISLPLW
jgi:hypothetical protein